MVPDILYSRQSENTLRNCCWWFDAIAVELIIHHLITFRWWNGAVVTHNSSVLIMAAVTIIPSPVPASGDGLFIPATLDVIHPNWKGTVSFSEIGISYGINSCRIVKHSAHNCSFPKAPMIVTDCSPLASVIHLNAALV